MAEYIEREAVLDDIDAAMQNAGMGVIVGQTLKRYVKRQPAADVVEVVWCKDCCYWEEVGIDPIINYRFGYCRHYQWQGEEGFDRETNNNDYCSYGRKRG